MLYDRIKTFDLVLHISDIHITRSHSRKIPHVGHFFLKKYHILLKTGFDDEFVYNEDCKGERVGQVRKLY